jgi:hypothetical protein
MSSLLTSNPATASDDLVARGQSTYRQRLASVLEPSHSGEFVAVEPDSGRYFLGSTASAALVAAHAAMPNDLFYLTRVGRETAHTMQAVSKVDYFAVRRQEHPSAAAAPGTPHVAAFENAD